MDDITRSDGVPPKHGIANLEKLDQGQNPVVSAGNPRGKTLTKPGGL
jgi:hypothetical protein